jgi:hypothetical protein
MAHEHEIRGIAGWPMVFLLAAVVLAASAGLVLAAREAMVEGILLSSLVIAIAGACFAGLTVVNPNQAKVVTLFGVYKGSLKAPGLWWVNPLTTRRRLSLRVRNFESGKLKVNDHDGNPIEIAAVIVWRIVETFEAVFNVDDYEHFVHVQTEAAVRILATTYPYDSHEDGQLSLRSSVGDITDRLRHAGPRAAGQGRHRGHRGADQSPGLRAGDRRCDAAPAAGVGGDCRAPENRRGRGRHGRNGARRDQPQRRRQTR